MEIGSAKQEKKKRLFLYSLGILKHIRLRQIIENEGYKLSFGLPLRKSDTVLVWGRKRMAERAIAIAHFFGRDFISAEDSFMRSVLTGREGGKSHGLIFDKTGIYYETDKPNDLETLLNQAPLIGDEERASAHLGIERMKSLDISKYNSHALSDPPDLPREFILLIDQTHHDASITGGGASSDTFNEMLAEARRQFPDDFILIKTHPETQAGKRLGHFGNEHLDENSMLWRDAISPWRLFKRAKAVFTVTSQMGLEAIFAGHKPHVFGRAFFAGRGLTYDYHKEQKRFSPVTKEEFYWAAYQKYSRYIAAGCGTPINDEVVAYALSERARHFRARRKLCVAGVKLWKRPFFKHYFKDNIIGFWKDPHLSLNFASKKNAVVLCWSSYVNETLKQQCASRNIKLEQIEDGFIRSNGLGAALVKPLSLSIDDLGIYYDPRSESRLERYIKASSTLLPAKIDRAKKIQQKIIQLGISKYNLTSKKPPAYF